MVDGLVLVSRDADDGKIDVKDDAHDVGKGAALGAVGGAVIGLIFPPAFLASAAVGGGIGAGAGKILDRRAEEGDQGGRRGRPAVGQLGHRRALRGALGRDVEKALTKADKVSKHEVDSDSAEQVKANATSAASS